SPSRRCSSPATTCSAGRHPAAAAGAASTWGAWSSAGSSWAAGAGAGSAAASGAGAASRPAVSAGPAPAADGVAAGGSDRTRARIAETLAAAGFPVGPDDVLGAPAATAAHMREHHPGAACLLLSSGDVADDLDGVRLVGPGDDVDVVVLGGAGPEFSYEALDN